MQYRHVLCLCAAGMLRSPTAAFILGNDPYNYDTRSAGVDCGLIPLTPQLLEWADEVVFMEQRMREIIKEMLYASCLNRPVLKCLNIPDEYDYREPLLMQLICDRYRIADAEIT